MTGNEGFWKCNYVIRWHIFMIILFVIFGTGVSEIIVHPRDTEAVVGQKTYLNCSISDPSKGVSWYYYPVGTAKSTYIVLYGKVLQNYENRARMETSANTGEFNLVIQTVSRNDAGRYFCAEAGNGIYNSSELIVLDSAPVCGSSVTEDSAIGVNNCGLDPDELVLSCQATYHGNTPPIIKWKMDGKDIVVPQENYSDHVSSQLSVDVTSKYKWLHFGCQTTRSAVEQYSCSKSLNVISALNNYRVAEKKEGEEASCLVNSSLPCTCKWLSIENDNEVLVKDNHNITLSGPGLYKCEAVCAIRHKPCLLVAGLVKVSPAAQEEPSRLSVTNLVVLLIGVIAIVVSVCLSLYVLYTRKKIRVQKNKSETSCERTNSNKGENIELKEESAKLINAKGTFEEEIEKLKGEKETLITENEKLKSENEKLNDRVRNYERPLYSPEKKAERKSIVDNGEELADTSDGTGMPRWSCEKCTYQNHETASECHMCGDTRSLTPPEDNQEC